MICQWHPRRQLQLVNLMTMVANYSAQQFLTVANYSARHFPTVANYSTQRFPTMSLNRSQKRNLSRLRCPNSKSRD